MHVRPKSVAFVSWFLIGTGAVSVITTLATWNNQLREELMAKSALPPSVQIAMQATGLLVMIVCGVSMLRGKHWARTTYVAWNVVGLLVGLVTSPFKMMLIPGAVFFLIVTYLLYRPPANAFFAGATPPPRGGVSA